MNGLMLSPWAGRLWQIQAPKPPPPPPLPGPGAITSSKHNRKPAGRTWLLLPSLATLSFPTSYCALPGYSFLLGYYYYQESSTLCCQQMEFSAEAGSHGDGYLLVYMKLLSDAASPPPSRHVCISRHSSLTYLLADVAQYRQNVRAAGQGIPVSKMYKWRDEGRDESVPSLRRQY